jgi:hypothetical protein
MRLNQILDDGSTPVVPWVHENAGFLGNTDPKIGKTQDGARNPSVQTS